MSRDTIITRLSQDIFGPDDPESTEVLHAYPSDVYLTGILFPQNSMPPQEEMDQLQAEGSADIDSNDVSKDEVSLANTRRPSSMGLSFLVETSETVPRIAVKVSAGVYHRKYLPAGTRDEISTITENSGEINADNIKKEWERQPVCYNLDNLELDFLSKEIDSSQTGIDGLSLHVKTSRWGNKLLVTVAIVNSNATGEKYERDVYEEQCFFQTNIRINPCVSTRLSPRPIHGTAIDEDTKSASLIYRNVVDYAVGHTCSAAWPEPDDGNVSVPFVETAWLPRTIVNAMSGSGIKEFTPLSQPITGPVLSTAWLSANSGPDLVNGLRQLADIYGAWLDQQSQRNDFSPDLRDQVQVHINQANVILKRIRDSIELIAKDKTVETAFRLANCAIRLQRKWARPKEPALIWRPFQLAFILLALSSVADEEHEDRNTADLLWFPTGGGKTEAYLGLIAFTLFFRRMKYGEQGAGVASLMRYTLRLLTIQQFQRAAALVCACDAIRRGEELPGNVNVELGKTPFSLGLWVGRDATPNTFKDAVKALSDEKAPDRPDKVRYCPKHTNSKLSWLPDYENKKIYPICPEHDCKWNSAKTPLPIWTVDEDIYRFSPSLIIGTIDKFAQIARKPETVSLFGSDSQFRQPDLIIQDELHLISGPLGTLAGLYEVAIDKLCSRDEIKPKIIASTATIRQASAQIKSLFDRSTCLFPPPIIDAINSGFAVEDERLPARGFIGITTAGRSAKFTLQAVAASLMQTVATLAPDNAKDDYWSLVAYFNSLRELGGALVLMQDDVPKSIEEYASRRGGETPRPIPELVELTSRVSSSEITDILDRLAIRWDKPGCCDIMLASNMMSVGVDIQRLGMMVVNGQPKGIAEYIQATSRVGRRLDGPGGLIVTIYNNAKSRDRSHYETFQTWHRALYREVEATSVTPFAVRAREKAIHAVLTILVRHLIPDLRTRVSQADKYASQIREFLEYIVDRARNIDEEETEETRDLLEEFIDNWVSSSGVLRNYWNDMAPSKSLLISAEKAAEIAARKGIYSFRAKPTPNSLRNVEPSSLFKLSEELRDSI